MMELLRSILLLLLPLFQTRLIASADRKFGCLFEADVCKSYEICVNDGVFGRCQLVTVIDVYKYEVSPTDLQRLRVILQELSLRGLLWHDDTTQQVIAKELSNLRRTHHLHPEAGSSDSLRATKEKIASEEDYKDYKGADDGDLQGFESLHQYLQLLSALSQPANPMPSHKTRTDKSETAQSDSSLDELLQRHRGKTSSNHDIAFHHPYPDNEHAQSRPLSQVQQQGGHLQSQEGFPVNEHLDNKQLVALLESYLRQKLAARGNDLSVNPDVWQQEGENKESQGWPPRSELLHWKAHDRRPELKEEKALYKSSASKINGKNPLSNMDENFIQSVVQQLGTQHVNVDGLTAKQLDELSDVIADALQVVDDDTSSDVRKGSLKTKPDLQQQEEEEANRRDEFTLEKQDDEVNEEFPEKSQPFKAEDESSEVKKSLDDILDLDSLYSAPHKNRVKTFGSSTKGNVGIENVKSNTITREVSNNRKSEGVMFGSEEEPNRWVEASLTFREPQKKNSQMGDQQLDVASSKTNLYGYIVTQKNPLSVEKGLELMEDLAHLLKLQINVFEDVSMMGPAVIFQVKVNGQNVSTADVVNVAVINKKNWKKEQD
ncbi:receptor-type tyrosine-protein phosphatase N2-like [Scyliorhinus canicula]|uniref:receptor-type tyrosine-protein phosphatase N2-like n=1 Tax=Scyliorhinus canicula TaxID=7830 RepID=UPI0018F6E2EB|nr:receptor-type tyrosine-protein phosphatase N2-like [Scyliorhinus canicula]